MALAWQVMIPLAIINLLCVMVVREFDLTPWLLTVTSVVTFIAAAVIATRERSTVISRPMCEPLAASPGA
jgi:NADH-quinone oxidoreductase subunit H